MVRRRRPTLHGAIVPIFSESWFSLRAALHPLYPIID
jgi:hypothetical protein